jgi:hypothetical protein
MAKIEPQPERVRTATDRGVLRDKVVGTDPAAAPLGADAEASGAPTPPAAAEQAERTQAAAARAAVPRPNASRTAASTDYPDAGSSYPSLAILAGALVLNAALVAVALVFTLPG